MCRADCPTIHVPIVLKPGSLNVLEPSGPVQNCNGIALPFTSPCPTLMYRLRLPSSFVLTIRLGVLHNSVGIMTRLRDIDPGFGSQQEQKMFLFSEVSRPALGPTQLHIKCVPGGGE